MVEACTQAILSKLRLVVYKSRLSGILWCMNDDHKPTPAELRAAENHLDRLRDIEVSNHDKLLVVGENACGKSLFRQIIKVGDSRLKVFHASMQLRTASNPGMGAFSSMTHDLPWLATSHSTLHVIKQVLKSASVAEKEFCVCIDEPETGLGFGAQRGLAKWLYPELDKFTDKASCTMVITHSPIFVKSVPSDWRFLDLSLKPTSSREEWLDRQLDENYSINPDDLLAKAGTMFETVRDRINERTNAKPKTNG